MFRRVELLQAVVEARMEFEATRIQQGLCPACGRPATFLRQASFSHCHIRPSSPYGRQPLLAVSPTSTGASRPCRTNYPERSGRAQRRGEYIITKNQYRVVTALEAVQGHGAAHVEVGRAVVNAFKHAVKGPRLLRVHSHPDGRKGYFALNVSKGRIV